MAASYEESAYAQVYGGEQDGSEGTEPSGAADTGDKPTGEVADTAPAPGQEDQPPFRWDNVPAELVPLAKGFQGDYTREMQALAEQKRAFGAQQQEARDAMALVQSLQEDPAGTVEWLQRKFGAQQVTGQAPAGETAETPFFATDTERLLWDRHQATEQQLRQMQAIFEQQQAQQNIAHVAAAFDDLEKGVGRPIPDQERETIANSLLKLGFQFKTPADLRAGIEMAWRSSVFGSEVNRARQAGVDQGAAVVQQKQGLPQPPATLATRTSSEPAATKGIDEAAAAAWSQISQGS